MRKHLIFYVVVIATVLAACSYSKYNLGTTATMSPDPMLVVEMSVSPAEDPTILPPEIANSVTTVFPTLYLTLDPSIPPFKSQMISIDLNAILSEKRAESEVITADSEFLGRDPNLTWAPDLSKAIFVNMNGVYLFDPETRSFSNLPPIPFHQTSVFWNTDNLRFAMVVENGKEFSSDILMMDSHSGLSERFFLDAKSFPTVLGWKDSQNLILFSEQFGFPAETEKVKIIDRNLFVLNIEDDSFTEILPNKNWLRTEAWELSPDGNKLLFRELLNAPEGTPASQTQLLDLNSLEEREIATPQGITEWINLEDIVIYDHIGFGEEQASLTWIKNWHEIQHVSLDATDGITEILVTPDGSAVVVFLSGFSPNRPGVPTGYKAFIITQDGQQKKFSIPGINSTDWIVQHAAWGK